MLAEDSIIVRSGLERLLSREGHDVVATLSRTEALAAVVAADTPDAVVLDIRMPPSHTDEGLRAATALRVRWPNLGILVLSQYIVPEYALRLLETGEKFTGYLLKDRILDAQQLTQALERIVGGGTVVDPDLIAALFASQRKDAALQALSGRELDVLRLVAEGLSDKGIAERLVLSTHTVGTHIRHIFQKLDVPGSEAANRRVLAALTYLQRPPRL